MRTVVGSAIAVAGTVWLAFAGYQCYLAFTSRHWPVAQGLVTDSAVKEVWEATHPPDTGPGPSRVSISVRDELRFGYWYAVDGQEFRAKRIAFGSTGSIHDIARKYRKGSHVVVFYDPAVPARSVLEPGLNQATYGLLGGAVATISAGAALALTRRRSLPDRAAERNRSILD